MSRSLPFGAFLLLCSVSPASADVKSVEVRSEVETPIDIRPVVLGEACKFGVVPRIVITKPPVNGALLVQTEVVRIPDSDPVCSGKVLRAAVIYYKSVVGYRGPDSFSYEEMPDSGQSYEVEIDIK
ncbi:MAG: hypothetical protein JO124_16400 [Hyphomicrobiales bacterium]|nr:hypothetical protein [Hyphomicrobiales bacterium]MBV9052014.1 hypothetical protein [Hyphomicrobiales bacterium]MBV9974167.1 hypothetical protein [Hyphomicrobiales bacterium]